MKQIAILTLATALICACESPTTPASHQPSGLLGITPDPIVRLDLGTLGGLSSAAADVNNSGTIVGSSLTTTGETHAFRWTLLGGMVDLGTLPGDGWSKAIGITDDGQILGVSGGSGQSHGQPVIWTSGEPESIVAMPEVLSGASFGEPTAFNAQGEIAGWDFVINQHAFYWSESRGRTDLTELVGKPEGDALDINASGMVVGTNLSYCPDALGHFFPCWHGFLWSYDNGYRDLGTPDGHPNATVQAWGINNDGMVVGVAGAQPFRWRDGEGFTLLPTVSGSGGGTAIDVNQSNTAVGQNGVTQAAAWPASGGILLLNPGDSHRSNAVAINDQGWVVGWLGVDPASANHATLWILSPSPAGLLAGTVGRPSASATSATSGSGSCLAPSEAVVSKQALIACALGRNPK